MACAGIFHAIRGEVYSTAPMEVSVVKDGREVTKLIATPEKASFFGRHLKGLFNFSSGLASANHLKATEPC